MAGTPNGAAARGGRPADHDQADENLAWRVIVISSRSEPIPRCSTPKRSASRPTRTSSIVPIRPSWPLCGSAAQRETCSAQPQDRLNPGPHSAGLSFGAATPEPALGKVTINAHGSQCPADFLHPCHPPCAETFCALKDVFSKASVFSQALTCAHVV